MSKKTKFKISPEFLLRKPLTNWEKFHNKTKTKKFSKSWIYQSIPMEWKKNHYKGYPRLKAIKLPKPYISHQFSLKDALVLRQSWRKFSQSPLSINQISTLLYYSAGMKKVINSSRISRFYPSAGARYPLEIYLISLNSDLPKGLYHYYIKSHHLESLCPIDSFDYRKYFKFPWIQDSSCLIIITAIFKRMIIKYGDLGYRYIMIECGHLAQNFYLVSTMLNIGCCAIGGFIDDNLNKLLDIDGITEASIYALSLG